jgi:hypothetical protein
MHIPTCDKLRDEFMRKYKTEFDITGGGLIKIFLGMEIEQTSNVIKLHLDNYTEEVLSEYKDYLKKALRLERVPMSPG